MNASTSATYICPCNVTSVKLCIGTNYISQSEYIIYRFDFFIRRQPSQKRQKLDIVIISPCRLMQTTLGGTTRYCYCFWNKQRMPKWGKLNCFWIAFSASQTPRKTEKHNSGKQPTVDCSFKLINRSGVKHSVGKVIPHRSRGQHAGDTLQIGTFYTLILRTTMVWNELWQEYIEVYLTASDSSSN